MANSKEENAMTFSWNDPKLGTLTTTVGAAGIDLHPAVKQVHKINTKNTVPNQSSDPNDGNSK